MSVDIRDFARHRRSAATPRLPLVVRIATDVEALRTHSRAVRRLPREGLRVRIDGLNPDVAEKLEARIRSYIAACGCGEGGAAALGVTLVVLASIAMRTLARGPRWGDLATVALGMLLALALGGLGKLFGIAVARFRFERYCSNVMRMIATSDLHFGRK